MKRLFAFMAMCTMTVTWFSCSNDLEENVILSSEDEVHTAVMHLDASRPAYVGKRTASTEWNEGDVIYLRFYQADGTTVICGKATYNASTSLWSISYYGNLATGDVYRCEAFYFTGATAVDNFNITMTPTSCAYTDLNATYTVDGGELFVSANLSPKTARMRIAGTAGQEIDIMKVIYNTSFNLTEKSFTTASDTISFQIGEDGYTPYIYGMLDENNEITVRDTYYAYTKTFDPANFTAGISGYITMPSQVENKGWTQTYYYPEEAVDLGLSVRWASMNVGATAPDEAGIFCAWGDPDGTYTGTSSWYNENVEEIAGNPMYDIATNLWGERWQIPTKEQWEELQSACTWEYQYDSSLGTYGYLVTGSNGNCIYLPLFDIIIGTAAESTNSQYGYYWTSTRHNTSSSVAQSYNAYLHSSSVSISCYNTYYRTQIRPVLVK